MTGVVGKMTKHNLPRYTTIVEIFFTRNTDDRL